MHGVRQHLQQQYEGAPVRVLDDHTLDRDFLPPVAGNGRVTVVINEMLIDMKIDALDAEDRMAYVDYITRWIDSYILLYDFPGGPEQAVDGLMETLTTDRQRSVYLAANGIDLSGRKS